MDGTRWEGKERARRREGRGEVLLLRKELHGGSQERQTREGHGKGARGEMGDEAERYKWER